jgi:hypothetical protein
MSPSFDQGLDCATNGGPGELETLGKRDLVLYAGARRQRPLPNGHLKLCRDLVIERCCPGAIQISKEGLRKENFGLAHHHT